MRIFIDAGHGGDSIGASYKGRLEQDDTLRLSKAVAEKLKKVNGIEVKLSRTGNTNPTITERCTAANVWEADYFVSIHRNAFSPEKAHGAESWVKSSVSESGNTYAYAKKLKDALVKCGFTDRGVKKGAPAYADYGVNRLTKMHSCLLECGFIDNTADNKIFDEKFDMMAEELAKALCGIVDVAYPSAAKTAAAATAPVTSSSASQTVAAKSSLNMKPAVEDARKVLRYAVGLEKDLQNAVQLYDYDGDGKITTADARTALNLAVGNS